MWKPKEIIINEKVKNDPATRYFLDQCQGVPVTYVNSGLRKDIVEKSKILQSSGPKMLDKIIAGKQVVYISPATTAVDQFDMPDDRMLCPHFDRLKLASNGCFYQCDWCYLKLTYRESRPFITVKAEHDKIKQQLEKRLSQTNDPVIFNSGEMADSLAMEHLTGTGREFIPWFGNTKNGYLFMLTKSDNVDAILDLDHKDRTIIAWSMNNDVISRKFEIGAPSFNRRLNAAEKVQKADYPLRIRLDPIVPFKGWKEAYAETIKTIFDKVSPERITIGTLRFEKGFYNMRDTIFTTGPELPGILGQMEPMFEPKLFDGLKKPKFGKYSFSEDMRTDIFKFVIDEIRKYSDCKIALCKESASVWDASGLERSRCSCVCQLDYADMAQTDITKQEFHEKNIPEIIEKSVPQEKDRLVYESFQKLKEIFVRHFHEAMLEAGHYLMDKFYNDDFQRVFDKKPINKGALHQLHKMLNQNKDNVPSRGWIYSAVSLAAHEKYFQINNFQTFGNLGHSQKLLLLNVSDFSKKQEIAQIALDKKFSVRELKNYIKQKSGDYTPQFNLLDLPPKETLIHENIETLEQLKRGAELKIKNQTKELAGYKKAVKKIDTAIKERNPSPAELRRAIKNNEWTLSRNNVNFSTGCSNNCLYCYGRYMPYANKLSKMAKAKGKEFNWGEAKIRKKDVDKSRSLHDGRVGFPTSHDITPENLEDYLTVLGKLLKAGNKIMIISKPNLECIKPICRASAFFKNKILFRFTITAKSADILSFWEPNAPAYEERIQTLKHAFDNGFQTSVSMEPVLEFSRVQEMVKEMIPFVTDAIWFGKMNHIKAFNSPDEKLKEELGKVEAGQSDENIKLLYSLYKDNPKIKWKLAFKELLRIPLPPAPGMDV